MVNPTNTALHFFKFFTHFKISAVAAFYVNDNWTSVGYFIDCRKCQAAFYKIPNSLW